MGKYEIMYDCDDGFTVSEIFEGSWMELQDYIKELRTCGGCSNISANSVGGE